MPHIYYQVFKLVLFYKITAPINSILHSSLNSLIVICLFTDEIHSFFGVKPSLGIWHYTGPHVIIFQVEFDWLPKRSLFIIFYGCQKVGRAEDPVERVLRLPVVCNQIQNLALMMHAICKMIPIQKCSVNQASPFLHNFNTDCRVPSQNVGHFRNHCSGLLNGWFFFSYNFCLHLIVIWISKFYRIE